MNYVFEYNDHIFDILLSRNTTPGYEATNSIESQYLDIMEAASFCDNGDEEAIRKMLQESDTVEEDIKIKVLEASRALMQNEAAVNEASGMKLQE